MKKIISKILGLTMILAMIFSVIPAMEVKAATDNYTVIVLENSDDHGYGNGSGVTVYTIPSTLKMVKSIANDVIGGFGQSVNNEYVAIVTYDAYGANLVCSFATDYKYLEDMVNGIEMCDTAGFNMAEGLKLAENLLSGVSGDKKNVVVINQGSANSGSSEYDYNGYYNSNDTGTWQWTSTGVKTYAYSNVAFNAALSLKQIARVYSVSVIPDGYPSKVSVPIEHQKQLSRDIASYECYYGEQDIEGLQNALADIRKKEIDTSTPFKATTQNELYGTVSGPSGVKAGDTVTLEAYPSVGYTFDGWYEGDKLVSKSNPYTFVAGKDGFDLVAHFSWDDSKSDDDIAKDGEKDSRLKQFILVGKKDKNNLKFTWDKVDGNVTYEIYLSNCDGNKNYKKIGTTTTNSCVIDKLDKKKAYKGFVMAYDYVDGAKHYLAKAVPVHVAMPGQKNYTNAKSVSVNKSSVTLNKGKSVTIKPSAKLEDTKKKIVTHVNKFRYLSSNPSVATVSKSGKIVGKSAGTCTVYAIANNGVNKKVKVTVK